MPVSAEDVAQTQVALHHAKVKYYDVVLRKKGRAAEPDVIAAGKSHYLATEVANETLMNYMEERGL